MYVHFANKGLVVSNNNHLSLDVGFNYIGYHWNLTSKIFWVFPDYQSTSIQVNLDKDEVLKKLVKTAWKHKDEQAALCAYDRLVELGYLQLPEDVVATPGGLSDE